MDEAAVSEHHTAVMHATINFKTKHVADVRFAKRKVRKILALFCHKFFNQRFTLRPRPTHWAFLAFEVSRQSAAFLVNGCDEFLARYASTFDGGVWHEGRATPGFCDLLKSQYPFDAVEPILIHFFPPFGFCVIFSTKGLPTGMNGKPPKFAPLENLLIAVSYCPS